MYNTRDCLMDFAETPHALKGTCESLNLPKYSLNHNKRRKQSILGILTQRLCTLVCDRRYQVRHIGPMKTTDDADWGPNLSLSEVSDYVYLLYNRDPPSQHRRRVRFCLLFTFLIQRKLPVSQYQK